jgi:hypothetical protein
MVANHASAQKYLFYLHGKIIEDKGVNAVSPHFGVYRYEAIIDSFREGNFIVMSEVRKSNTNISAYARYIADKIESLLKTGVEAKNITVIGASKGALIAMYVSTFLKNHDLNFVFLAACNEDNFTSFPDLRFHGNILSIYERSDDIGRSCLRFRDKASSNIIHYKEIELNTGLQHGFIFRPLPEWMKPAMDWANARYK